MDPVTNESVQATYTAVPGRAADDPHEIVTVTPDGIQLDPQNGRDGAPFNVDALLQLLTPSEDKPDPPELALALVASSVLLGLTPSTQEHPLTPDQRDATVDRFGAGILVVPCSNRWRQALSTSLLGSWCDPLWETGQLRTTALGALKAEARTLHRELVPVWRRGTRHGRVLSLDADLGGLSLYDLVVSEVDFLAHTAGGVFADERLNWVLRGLSPAEREVVFAYAEDEGTWTEAAAYAGATDPAAFGERVRRKVHRLAAEQHRRAAQRRPAPPAA